MHAAEVSRMASLRRNSDTISSSHIHPIIAFTISQSNPTSMVMLARTIQVVQWMMPFAGDSVSELLDHDEALDRPYSRKLPKNHT
jgi:hypothetical protein